MTKLYSCISEYIRDISQLSSDTMGWGGLEVTVAREFSNDVRFAGSRKDTINITLSGTKRHTTRMDGIVDHTPTSAGDAILMPAGLAAEFSWETIGPFESSILIEFDDELFKTYCPDVVTGGFLGGHLLPTNYAPKPQIAALAQMMARELDPCQRRGRLFAETAIRLLALELSASKWTRQPLRLPDEAGMDPRVCRAVDYIEQFFAEDISLVQLSEVSGLGVGQLTTLFRRHTGRTPYLYLIDRRIEHGVRMLRTTDRSIASIALESGFSDQQHMTRTFRRRLGRTPGAIRRQ